MQNSTLLLKSKIGERKEREVSMKIK